MAHNVELWRIDCVLLSGHLWIHANISETTISHQADNRGVATGGYMGIYTPKISPSKLLWGKNDVRTATEQFYIPPPKKKTNFWIRPWLESCSLQRLQQTCGYTHR